MYNDDYTDPLGNVYGNLDYEPPKGSTAEKIKGGLEVAKTLGTGLATSVAAPIYGVYKGLTSGQYLEGKAPEIGEREARKFAERNIYIPQTEKGQEYLGEVTEGIQKFLDVTKLPEAPFMPELIPYIGAGKGTLTQARGLARENLPKVVQAIPKNLPVGASIKPLDELPIPKDIKSEQTKVYAPADELGFYSNIEKASLNLQRKSGSGEAFLNDIMKQPGINKEELEWMGLPEFLKGRKGVTREEVQDFVKNNRIQFEEDVLGMNRNPNKKAVEAQREFDELVNSGKSDYETINRMNYLAEIIARNRGDFVEPEYANVARTPNGENYREILIRLPEQSKEKAFDDVAMELYGVPWNKLGDGVSPEVAYSRRNYVSSVATESSFKGSHFGNYKDILVHMRVDDRVDVDNKVGMLLDEIQSDWHQEGRKIGYKKGKTDDLQKLQAEIVELKAKLDELQQTKPNNVKYAVYDDRNKLSDYFDTRDEAELELNKNLEKYAETNPDARVIPTFFADEAYKKWEQQAGPIRDKYLSKKQRYDDLVEDAESLAESEDAPIFPVPNAPFKENYHEIAMKRALVEGAKGDYDRIYLPTGDDLVNRYKQSLTKQVDEVRLTKLPNDRYNFVATKNGAQVVRESNIPARRVREMLGKGAEDLIKMADNRYVTAPASPEASMKAQDLRVGGEGMRKYYDEIYPSFLKKFAKKYGGTVGKTEIPIGSRSSILDALQDANMTIDEFNALDAQAQEALYRKFQKEKKNTVFYYEFSPESRKKILGGVPMKNGGRVQVSKNPDVMAYAVGGSAKAGLKSLINKVREKKGSYEARRLERASDEVPNLEKQFDEEALYGLFGGDNARAIMSMNPKDFERFALPLTGLQGRTYNPSKEILNISHPEYIKYLSDIARNKGFESVPYLELNRQYYEGLLPYVSGHEGRHRARALAGLGDEKTIVQMVPRASLREKYPRREREEYLQAIKKEIGDSPLVIPEGRVYPNPRKLDLTDEQIDEMYELSSKSRYGDEPLTEEEYKRLRDLELAKDAPDTLPDWREAKQLPEMYSVGGAVAKNALEKMKEMLAKKAVQQDLSGESKRMSEYLRTGKMPEAKAITPEEIEEEYLRRQKEVSPPMKKGGKVQLSKNLDVMRLAVKR